MNAAVIFPTPHIPVAAAAALRVGCGIPGCVCATPMPDVPVLTQVQSILKNADYEVGRRAWRRDHPNRSPYQCDPSTYRADMPLDWEGPPPDKKA